MLKNYAAVFALLSCSFFPALLKAQQDTEFWFVAPELVQRQQNYDRPVVFRFFSYDAPATVTVYQPANDTFPVQTLTLPAHSDATLDLTPWLQLVENFPNSMALKKGFLIQSTAPITAYYEVIGESQASTEIFSLKGRRALGTQFYVPFQNLIGNVFDHPQPHSGFDIVATEDSTLIVVTPTEWLVDHPVGITFSFVLNRGETYLGQTGSQPGFAHPGGTVVTSDKPIAITVKDDLLEGGVFYGGDCRDVTGDQILPVSQTGTRYAVQQGFLSGPEYVFVVATNDNTLVQLDGAAQGGPLDAGESLALEIGPGSHLVSANEVVYCWQMTGIGCQLGGAIVPPLPDLNVLNACGGAYATRFFRTNSAPFYLSLVTAAGNEGNFSVNGDGSLVVPGAFQPVSGTNGDFVAALVLFNPNHVPPGESSLVENSSGAFQVAVLSGSPGSVGCNFAFLSTLDGQVVVEDTVQLCYATPATVHGLTIDTAGVFTTVVVNPTGCDTIYHITASMLPPSVTTDTLALCPGQSFEIGGQIYFAPHLIHISMPGANGCYTEEMYVLLEAEPPMLFDTISICPGESVGIGGQFYDQPGTYADTLFAAGDGCDTLVFRTVKFEPTDFYLEFGGAFCAGGGVNLNYLLCNLGDGPFPPEVPIAFFDADPTNAPANLLGIFMVNATSGQACESGTFADVGAVLFPNGAGKIYAVTNLDGALPTPFSLDEIAGSGLAECEYANNLDSAIFMPQTGSTLDLGPDTLQCENEAVIFNAGAGFSAYLWQNGSTGSTFAASATGLYFVEVTDACGGVQRDSVFLIYNPIAHFPFPDVSLCPGQSTFILQNDYEHYLWSPPAGLSCATCMNVTIQPAATTTYTLEAVRADGCVLRDTFTVIIKPSPERTDTLQFCTGESIVIGGQVYTQPGIVVDTLSSTTGGCDTLATYVLQHLTPGQPTTVVIDCPGNITAQAASGAPAVLVNFAAATATSDCPCPGLELAQTAGLPSGSQFPVGNNPVCFSAADSCGNTASCCFTVAVEAAEDACDTKVTGCVQYELLGISLDAEQNRTYRIRVTNNCANKLIYTAFQTPDGIAALAPANNSTYTAPSGRDYLARNPNYAPFYSVRFKSSGDGIAGGASDVFSYTLPAQSSPVFIHASTRIEPGIFYETHLNTFGCPVAQTASSDLAENRAFAQKQNGGAARLFPNPSDGTIWVNLRDWENQAVRLRVFNGQGRLVQEIPPAPAGELEILTLHEGLPEGLYYLEITPEQGAREVVRFVLKI